MEQASVSEPGGGERGVESAARHTPSHARFWGVAGALLWLDLWSKNWIFASLAPDETRALLPNWIELRRSLNDGAVFGSFTGQVGLFIVASVLALAFVVYLFAYSRRSQWCLHVALACILAGALGNLYDRGMLKADVITFQTLSGHESSFIGRVISDPDDATLKIGDWPEGTNPRRFSASEVHVRRQGVVRDFIKFVPQFPAWVPRLSGRDVWPWVFNVADATLVCGVLLMLVTCLPERKHSTPPREASA